MKPTLVRTSGRASRRLHAWGLCGRLTSGAIRKATAKLAAEGVYSYRNVHGHLLEADLADYIERAGFFGSHSADLVRAMTSILRPGDWAIDAGANVGLLSSAMAAKVGKGGLVWSIEPLPRNVARLQQLKAANGLGQLEIFPVALADDTSTARLRLSASAGGSGWASFVSPWAGDNYVDVATTPLDRIVSDHGSDRPLRLIKIDLEGFEMRMLSGAQETLESHRPFVVCEFHDPLLRAAGTSSDELLEAFAGLGYAPRPPFGRPRGALEGKVVDMLLAPGEAPGLAG